MVCLFHKLEKIFSFELIKGHLMTFEEGGTQVKETRKCTDLSYMKILRGKFSQSTKTFTLGVEGMEESLLRVRIVLFNGNHDQFVLKLECSWMSYQLILE